MLEFNNVYDYENILKILSSIFSTGYFISQYFLTTEKFNDKLILDEYEFLKYWNKPNYKKFKKYEKEIIYFKLKCEPKWDLEFKNVTKIIYHVTNSENVESIMKNGLLPSSGKKKGYHPERVYFCKNKKDIEQMKYNLNLFSKSDLCLLEIDTTNLNVLGFDGKEHSVVFYKDENSNGIYTYDMIKPENIKYENL